MTISLLELKNQINSLKKGSTNKDEINSIIEQYLLENQDILSKEQITKIVSEEKINPIIQKYLSEDRKSTRLNSSHANISYAVFCLKKKTISFVAYNDC